MDLYSGAPYWLIKNPLYDYYNPLKKDIYIDVAIVGGGITGALVSYELGKAGFNCCVIDRRSIGTGSSVASTALLQYEIDVPLFKMIKLVGENNAVTAYRSCIEAINDIENIFKQTEINAEFQKVPSIYFASDQDGEDLINEEYKVRKQYDLPVELLDNTKLFSTYNFNAPVALINRHSAQMDMYKAAVGLLKYNMEHHKLTVYSHTEIKHKHETSSGYQLISNEGYKINCKYLVIAAGFEAGTFLPEKVMQLTSTYALVSHPVDPKLLWPENCLIWETKEPYIYIRTTGHNRIIVGGEDEQISDPQIRDGLMRQKAKKLSEKFQKLFPSIPLIPEMVWSGTFSSTKDGLPFIGKWPGIENMFFDLSYGGNGITFSMIGAQIIKNNLLGISDEREEVFSFERKSK